MVLLLVLLGIFTGTLLSVLIGFIGSRRRIGFGWPFLISICLTPLFGLVVALLSEKLPDGERRWGCFATLLALVVLVLLIAFTLFVVGAVLDGSLSVPIKYDI